MSEGQTTRSAHAWVVKLVVRSATVNRRRGRGTFYHASQHGSHVVCSLIITVETPSFARGPKEKGLRKIGKLFWSTLDPLFRPIFKFVRFACSTMAMVSFWNGPSLCIPLPRPLVLYRRKLSSGDEREWRRRRRRRTGGEEDEVIQSK